MNEAQHYDYFLVKYDDGYNYGRTRFGELTNNELLEYLDKERFSCTAGFWGCPWYFIDIVNKKYKPGRPGLSYGKVIGEHAITFEEFKTIYDIYKKYKGLSDLSMTKEEDIKKKQETKQIEQKRSQEIIMYCKWTECSFEKYKKQVKWCLINYHHYDMKRIKEDFEIYNDEDFKEWYNDKWAPATVATGMVLRYI